MNLSKNFTLAELTASHTAATRGLANVPNAGQVINLTTLAETLEIIREEIGGPIIITSGYRTYLINTMIGGAKRSAHMSGYACDFKRPGMTAPALFRAVAEMGRAGKFRFDQLIEYHAHVHLSVDPRFRGQIF